MTDQRRLGPVTAGLFAASAVNAAWMPVWFADRGLAPAQIGLILGVASLLRIAATPMGGHLADVWGRRFVLGLAAVVAGAMALLLPLFGAVANLLVVTAVMGVAAALLPALADALTLGLAAAKRLDYGRTRAWGSIAYMLATAAAGALLSRTGSVVVPYLLAGFYALTAALTLRVPVVAGGSVRGGGLAGPLRHAAFRWVVASAALIQGSHAAYYAFAPLHWRAAGLSDTVIGLLIAEGIVAEIALFLWGRNLVEHLGPVRLTLLAAGACAIRWTALAFTVEAGALAVLQVLHAGTFAFQHLSSMMVVRRLPGERAAMAQTLLSSLGFSAPTAVLVWLTGQLYGHWGGLVFLLMAAVGGAGALTVPGLARALKT